MPALPRPRRRPRAPQLVATAALAVLVAGTAVAAQGPDDEALETAAPTASEFSVGTVEASPSPAPAASAPAAPAPAAPLAPLAGRAQPDVLVTGPQPLAPEAVTRLSELTEGGTALVFRSGTVAVGDQLVPAVGVDPAAFRTYAAEGTAEATDVWQAVARGEVVASHDAATRLGLVLGQPVGIVPAGGGAPVPVRLGALATTGLPDTDLVVSDAVGDRLGLPAATGVVLDAADGRDPVALAGLVREVTGEGAAVDLLSQPAGDPTAFLTGGAAAKAFGAFSYKYFPDGTIQPDAAWVRDNIRTEQVPVFGTVTCHRLMLPQLRGALAEVEARGLAGKLTTYDGCYVPRFIERNPGGSISLHTWGIAIDMDASTNYRGIRGTMDPEVVAIFKRWGFRWGGDWKYTDPMHFEMGAVLK